LAPCAPAIATAIAAVKRVFRIIMGSPFEKQSVLSWEGPSFPERRDSERDDVS
jgi:hypothetical protein